MQKKVFISYAREDRPLVLKFKSVIERGISCWMDTSDIIAGTYYREQIALAIKECDVVLLFASSKANESEAVFSEILFAKECGKRVVVAKIYGTNPSSMFMERVHFSDYVVIGDADVSADAKRLSLALSVSLLGMHIARRMKAVAVALSIIPGFGCIYLGFKRVGFSMLGIAIAAVIVSYQLELGTKLDCFLASVFFLTSISSVVITINMVALGCNKANRRRCHWLPYCLSVISPGSGMMFVGRWRTGFVFMVAALGWLAVIVFSGSVLSIQGYPLDSLALHFVWLIGIGESGFMSVKMRHRNPIIYAVIIAVLLLVVCSFLGNLRVYDV